MSKFQVHLGRLVRQEKVIEVEAESVDEINLNQLYEDDDGAECSPENPNGWTNEGCTRGTHFILDESVNEIIRD